MLKLTFIVSIFAFLISCAESLPERNNKATPTNAFLQYSPVVIAPDVASVDQEANAVVIDAQTSVVLADTRNELDNSALISNRNIKSRAVSDVGLKTSGSSQITQRVYYMAGEVFIYTTFEYDAAGLRTRRTTFNGAGLDAVWFTADDDIKNYAQFDVLVNQVQTHYVSYNGPGPDGIWLNDDDSVEYYMADLLDVSGNVVAVAHYNSPGGDLSWFTTDDVIQWAYTMSTNADNSSDWVLYETSGVDLDWATLDDNVIGHFAQKTVDTNNQVDRHIFYMDPGLDGVRYTEDDTIGFYHDYTYDAQNQLSEAILYQGGAGLDNLWFTADDVVAKCESRDHNADGTLNILTRAKPGIDLTCFTADDVITSYDDHTYDATGHLKASNLYGSPGVDGIWFNSDDAIVKESTFVVK